MRMGWRKWACICYPELCNLGEEDNDLGRGWDYGINAEEEDDYLGRDLDHGFMTEEEDNLQEKFNLVVEMGGTMAEEETSWEETRFAFSIRRRWPGSGSGSWSNGRKIRQ